MTRINFKRTGRVTGREVDADIDLNELPDSGAQELTRMLKTWLRKPLFPATAPVLRHPDQPAQPPVPASSKPRI